MIGVLEKLGVLGRQVEGYIAALKSKETYLASKPNHMKGWKREKTAFMITAGEMVSSGETVLFT